jgi:arginyl-tRNA synthetase
MSADSKTQLADLLRAALLSVAPEQAETPINLERPKQAGHGDFASNLALQLAKPLKRNPRELANLLLAELPASSLIAKAEVAGAGFINFTLVADAKTAVVGAVLAAGEAYGRASKPGSGCRWNMSPPTPPGRFTSGMAVGPPMAPPCRMCSTSPASR